MAKKKSKRSGGKSPVVHAKYKEPGLLGALRNQPMSSMLLMVGGAFIGLLVAGAVPAVRHAFGMSGISDGAVRLPPPRPVLPPGMVRR